MKIQSKIQLAFFAIGFIPLLLFGWLYLDRMTSMLRDRLRDQLEAVASVQQKRIETLLKQNLERLKLVSSRTQLRLNLARYQNDPQETYRKGMLRILSDARNSISSFRHISVVNPEGQVLVSTNPDWPEQDVSQSEFFRLGRQENRTDIFSTNQEGDLLAILSGPLTLEGQTIGVLVVICSGEDFLATTQSHDGLGESGETILVRQNQEGELQYLTPLRFDPDATLRTVPRSAADYSLLQKALQTDSQEALEAVDYRGFTVLAVPRTIVTPSDSVAVNSASLLGLIVKIDRTEAFALVRQLRNFSYAILGATLLTVIAVSLILSNSITRPIHTLTKTANLICEGNLDRRARVESNDEIAELAQDFNHMANSLTEANRTLEEKVRQRTSDLEIIRERYSLAVRGSTDGLWDWNIETNEVVFSDRFKELLDYPPDGFENRFESWESRLHEEDKAATLSAVKAHLEEGKPYDVEYRLSCRNGVYRWFRARGTAIRNDRNQPVRMAGSISDITDRKLAEQELKRSNEELEQFAYVASHDLKEPLRMITSYLQLLEKRCQEKLDSEAREFIGIAVDGAARMKRLIEDLLLFSRVGTQGREPIPTDTSAALRAALDNLQAAIHERKARINAKPLPRVLGDSSQLIQLFQNLIGNAVKFCPAGEAPDITIDAVRCHDLWEFRVRDNGIGIAPENLERIFQIFQRGCGREEYGGTGIGLAVCKKIVERHGGEIRVESTPGQGSTFIFTLRPA